MARKLGRTSEQRMAILRNQASELLWNGRIETTVDRAKEVRSYTEKLLTLAINSFEDVVTVTKERPNSKGEKVAVEFKNDGGKKLAARRRLLSSLRDIQPLQNDKEKKSDYIARTREIKHPLVEKVFREYAPFYAQRNIAFGQKGGYTRIIRLGGRRGDNAEMAIIELVKNMPEQEKKSK